MSKDFNVFKLWDFVIKSLIIHIVWFQQIISKVANLSRHLICGQLKLQINICQQKPIKVVSSSSPKLFGRCLKERSLKPMVLMPEAKSIEDWLISTKDKSSSKMVLFIRTETGQVKVDQCPRDVNQFLGSSSSLKNRSKDFISQPLKRITPQEGQH